MNIIDRFKKIYKIVFYLNIGLFIFFCYSMYQYGETYSDIKTHDKMIATYTHGKTYYVNEEEQRKINAIGWISMPVFFSVLGFGLYYKVKYKTDIIKTRTDKP